MHTRTIEVPMCKLPNYVFFPAPLGRIGIQEILDSGGWIFYSPHSPT